VIDWQARIDDLCRHLSTEHQIEDRPAVEILLSALVPCPRTPVLWLILETEWLRKECDWTWFGLGQDWALSLSELRTMRPRYLDNQLREYTAEPKTSRLLVEPDFEHLPRYRRRSAATGLHLEQCLAGCLRVRTPMPRSATVYVDGEIFWKRADTLRALTRHILDDPLHARPSDPPRWRLPPDFGDTVELVQKLAPWYPDWDQLITAFASLAVRHAWLYGRTETNEDDFRILARAAHDSVPPWVVRAVECLASSRGSGSKVATVLQAMHLPAAANPAFAPSAELRRLHQQGILRWHAKELTWSLVPEYTAALADVIDGVAFGGAAAAHG